MPSLTTFEPNSNPKAILAAIETDGAAIIRDLMQPGIADQTAAELAPFIDATPMGAGFTGNRTKRTGALATRSAGCRELILDNTVLDLVNTFLAPYCQRVQLHLGQVIRILPGQKEQMLHRDRQAWGEILPPSIEPQLNTIWALTDFTRENGATRVAPGSHRWDYGQQANESELEYAVMSRGSALIYTGSVIHSGGANNSDDDRTGINITYSLGWLRQEENQFLSCPPEIAKDFEPRLQELLGYSMGSTACGYFSEPLPAGEARELCPPEIALGRAPRPGRSFDVVDEISDHHS